MVTTEPKRFSQKCDKYRGRAESKVLFSRVFFVVKLLFNLNTYGVNLILYKYHPICRYHHMGQFVRSAISPAQQRLSNVKGGGWKGALFDMFLNRRVSPANSNFPNARYVPPAVRGWPPAWRPGAGDRAAQLSRRRSPHCPPPATTTPAPPLPPAVAIQPLYSVQAPSIVRLSMNELVATHRRGHVGSPRKALWSRIYFSSHQGGTLF